MSSATLQDDPSVESFFNVAETETLALFEHLSFEFLEEFDVFAPAETGRTRDHEPPELMRGFLHCYYHGVYRLRPVERELRNTVVWLSCGFDRPPSRDAVDRLLTDLEHVVYEVFERLVEQAAPGGLLDLTYSIDSTDVRAMAADPDASTCYDPTAEEYYYGYGCTIVSTGQKIPIAAEFTESKQALEETAMRVTRDALAVARPVWMLGDSAYDTLDWHDHLLAAGVVPVVPYNPRNTDAPKDIEYRVEDRINEHGEDVQLKQSILDETYNRRTGVERTNEAVKDCGLGRTHARGRVHARAQVFLALCLRLVVAITNYERGDNPGSTIIMV
ncbi:IS4/IS5 family transposase [Haloplanus rallus]|uniref:IS4/IS5 family transposase n=1 Tax=Haloplanus rallus TaxID=1816183 RepID=A0A6B9F0P0_9EURY|nr:MULTISPECIES: transposase [Haloplanus]QGX93765.1 IS4/IS5 family transposase [Haloplanus rallus]